MTTKPVRKKEEEEEDFLGLIPLGSLIANLFQYASKKSLEAQHNALKAHYNIMLERYKQLSNAYLSMKKVNDGLYKETSTLNNIINELGKENNRLLNELAVVKQIPLRHKAAKPDDRIRRRRIVSSPEKIGQGTNA